MEPLRINSRLVLPPDELEVRFSRSGGPGGQNVNKLETQVELRFNLKTSAVLGETRRIRLLQALGHRVSNEGVLQVRCSSHRHRARNLDEARERMVELISKSLHIPKGRKATRPTKGSKKRRVDAKTRRGQVKRLRRRPGQD